MNKQKTQNEYSTLAWTTVLFAAANIVSKLIKFVLVPLYTYYMTTAEFGTSETVIITVNLLYPVLLLGVNEAALRFSMKDSQSAESVFSNCAAVLAVTSAAGLLLLLPLSHTAVFRAYPAVMFAITVATAAESLLKSEARGLGKNRVYAVSGIINAAVLLISAVILLAVLRTGIKGYLWSMAAAPAAAAAYTALSLRGQIALRPGLVNMPAVRSILRFSLPFMPATVLWWIMDSSGRYLVMWYLGSSAAGIYAVSFRLSAMLMSMAAVFHQAWQMSAIRQYSLGDCGPFFRSAMDSYGTLFFLAAALLTALAKPLILLLDDSYSEAWKYTPVLMIAAVFFSMSGLAAAGYNACERTGGVLWTSLAGAAASVAFGAVLTPRFGMYGAASAAALSYYMMWMIMTVHTGHIMGIRYDLRLIHADLLILLAETASVMKGLSPLIPVICIAMILLLNRRTAAGMLKGGIRMKDTFKL